MTDTTGWPEHFRLHVLEYYRKKLFQHATELRKTKKEVEKQLLEEGAEREAERESFLEELDYLEQQLKKQKDWRKKAKETLNSADGASDLKTSLFGGEEEKEEVDEEELARRAEVEKRQRRIKGFGRRALEDELKNLLSGAGAGAGTGGANNSSSTDGGSGADGAVITDPNANISQDIADTNNQAVVPAGGISGTKDSQRPHDLTPEQMRGIQAKLEGALASVVKSNAAAVAEKGANKPAAAASGTSGSAVTKRRYVVNKPHSVT
jgi:hypothetical protein